MVSGDKEVREVLSKGLKVLNNPIFPIEDFLWIIFLLQRSILSSLLLLLLLLLLCNWLPTILKEAEKINDYSSRNVSLQMHCSSPFVR